MQFASVYYDWRCVCFLFCTRQRNVWRKNGKKKTTTTSTENKFFPWHKTYADFEASIFGIMAHSVFKLLCCALSVWCVCRVSTLHTIHIQPKRLLGGEKKYDACAMYRRCMGYLTRLTNYFWFPCNLHRYIRRRKPDEICFRWFSMNLHFQLDWEKWM